MVQTKMNNMEWNQVGNETDKHLQNHVTIKKEKRY